MSGFDLNSDAVPGDVADGTRDAGATELKDEVADDINGCFLDACIVDDGDDRMKDGLSREGLNEKTFESAVCRAENGRNGDKEANEETENYGGTLEGDKEIINSSDRIQCAERRSFDAAENMSDSVVEMKAVDFSVSLSHRDQNVGTIESDEAMRLGILATETGAFDKTYNDQNSNVLVSKVGISQHKSECEAEGVGLPLNFDPCDGSDAITRLPNCHEPEKVINVSNSIKLSISDYSRENVASHENVLGSDERQSIELDEMGINTFQLKEDIEMETLTSASEGLECCVEDGFLESDLVWGKVRSHPWWPGQIFLPSAASEWAMKYFKRDSFLIAYFGDQTFAWNDASQLRPFRMHFSEMVQESNMGAFCNAVNCALNEVSRRVVFGLSCSCLPEQVYKKIKSQIMVNAGIRKELSIRNGGDRFSGVASFKPVKLVKYLKDLAQFPFETDRLELAVAQAQLSGYYHSKGYFQLPEFKMHGLLFEESVDVPVMMSGDDLSKLIEIPVSNCEDDEQFPFQVTDSDAHVTSSPKRKSILRKKEKTILELIAGDNDSLGKTTSSFVSSTSGTKRKAVDSMFDQSGEKNQNDRIPNKQSSTVGDRLRKIASQLIGSVPNLKSCDEMSRSTGFAKSDENPHKKSRRGRKRKIVTLVGCHTSDVWLSQLCEVATEPLEDFSSLPSMVTFFTEFQNFLSRSEKFVGTKFVLEPSNWNSGTPELEETEDMSPNVGSKRLHVDRYASMRETKRKVTTLAGCHSADVWLSQLCSVASEPLGEISFFSPMFTFFTGLRNFRSPFGKFYDTKHALEPPFNWTAETPELDEVLEMSLNVGSQQLGAYGNIEMEGENTAEDGKTSGGKYSATALVLTFADLNSVPSEANLNKIFSHYGPLEELETKVMKKSKRAKVVFQRRSDAEVAFSSSGKYSIFGPSLVSYRLRYISRKAPTGRSK